MVWRGCWEALWRLLGGCLGRVPGEGIWRVLGCCMEGVVRPSRDLGRLSIGCRESVLKVCGG